VARPCRSLESLCELLHVDPRLEAGGIHFLSRRLKDEIDACVLGDANVTLLVPGILFEVLCRPELSRVHEDADDDDVAFLPRRVEQGEVPAVQRTHRRHEPDLLAAGVLECGPDL
jgi:hypothetical protein